MPENEPVRTPTPEEKPLTEWDVREAVRHALLKSEQHWDAGRAFDLGGIIMPFGKYNGKALCEIPLRYLDGTVSVMPPTWLVRRVQEFVDLAMSRGEWGEVTGRRSVPNATFVELELDRERQEKEFQLWYKAIFG
jgi:hypothetical protein